MLSLITPIYGQLIVDGGRDGWMVANLPNNKINKLFTTVLTLFMITVRIPFIRIYFYFSIKIEVYLLLFEFLPLPRHRYDFHRIHGVVIEHQIKRMKLKQTQIQK